MNRVPTHREPTHPGEMLLEEFLEPMHLSQRDLADGIRVPYQRVNELVNKCRGVTPATALRLAKFLGR
jgi:addiction module HigA family antidote